MSKGSVRFIQARTEAEVAEANDSLFVEVEALESQLRSRGVAFGPFDESAYSGTRELHYALKDHRNKLKELAKFGPPKNSEPPLHNAGSSAGAGALVSIVGAAPTPIFKDGLPMDQKIADRRRRYDELVSEFVATKSALTKLKVTVPENWLRLPAFEESSAVLCVSELAWRVDRLKGLLRENGVDVTALLSGSSPSQTQTSMKPELEKMSVSEICTAVRLGTVSPEEGNAELSARRKAPKQKATATNAKANMTQVCADVRAGKITAAEGNRMISESRRK